MCIDLLNSNIHNSCQAIINGIRLSRLNFSLQETPFSLYITIRKSYHTIKNAQSSPSYQIPEESFVTNKQTAPNEDYLQLQSRCKFLEQANENLKQLFDEAVNENEVSHTTISDLNKQIEHFEESNDRIMAAKVASFAEEKRSLQIKHEKTCAENKSLKNDNENLKKDLNQSSVALKSAKKEIKDQTHKHEKKIDAFEDKMKDLLEYKSIKASEEKDLKIKLKKVEKKLKILRDKEAEIKIEKMNLERDKTRQNEANNNLEFETKTEEQNTEISLKCNHFPQCITRQPIPPPIGPLTFKQFELTEAVIEMEKIESEVDRFVENVVDFLRDESSDNLDITIAKLEAVKKMLDPNAEPEGRISQFDELIEMAKHSKDIIENMKNKKDEDDDDYFEYEHEDLPRHYYGEEGEIIFEDD